MIKIIYPLTLTASIPMTQYDNIVITPIYGPLNANQYPSAQPYHSQGTLAGQRPTPPQFYSSQEPPYAEENTNSRQQYKRATAFTPAQRFFQRAQVLQANSPQTYFANTTGRNYTVSTHLNYITPQCSSSYLNEKKSRALGKSAYKVGLPLAAPLSTKAVDYSNTRSHIRRVRGGGCVAPAKKGALANTSLSNGHVCSWGAIPRSTY